MLQTGWLSARAISSGNEGVGGGCCTLILALLVGTVHMGWSCRSTGCSLSGLHVSNLVVGRVCKGVGGGGGEWHFRILGFCADWDGSSRLKVTKIIREMIIREMIIREIIIISN